MSEKEWYIGRRGELLAQELLIELGATYVGALEQPKDIGLDYVAFFTKDDGTPVIIGVECKATERDVPTAARALLPASLVQKLQHANVPVLIILADVKHNDIYFNWATDIMPQPGRLSLRKATPAEKAALQQEILNPRVKVLD